MGERRFGKAEETSSNLVWGSALKALMVMRQFRKLDVVGSTPTESFAS